MRIMAADDDPIFANMIKEHLENTGHSVEIAANGKILLEMAKASPPDLIILDLDMPGIKGSTAQTMLKLNSKTYSIPIIVVSGLSKHAIETTVDPFSTVAVLTKPVKLPELDDIIRKVESDRQSGI